MEIVDWAIEADLGGTIWTDISEDVLIGAGGIHFDYGIKGIGPLDLVASAGNAQFNLDNSEKNSAGLLGYYTPGHANCRAGWDEGNRIRISLTYGATTYYKWVGWVSGIRPGFGIHRERRVEVLAVDWMDQAAIQKIGQLAIQSSKRADQALTTILAEMPIAPRATSFATGIETFTQLFNSEMDEKTSVLSLFHKLARNEYGRIYMAGETLRFESRHTRPMNQTDIVTIDNAMQDLQVEYDRTNVYNYVKARIYPLRTDAAATTVVATSQKKHSIPAGQSLTLTLEFRDPTTAKRISAMDIVWPLEADTDFKFGSSEGSASDLNASLSIAGTVGGNSAKLTFTNGASVMGWLNILQLRGKGIYPYDPQTLEATDDASIELRGELTLTVELEQHDTTVKGQAFADYLVNRYSAPAMVLKSIRCLANRSAALMAAAIEGEVSSRFALEDAMTAIVDDYFINAITIDLEAGGIMWFEWISVPASGDVLFIWDTSHWDIDTNWAF